MQSLKVKEYMNSRPVTFNPNTSVAIALEKLLNSNQTGGPVVDENNRLIGFLSEQDMLHKLLKMSYHCEDTTLVSECMRTDVLSSTPDSSIVDLAETMTGEKPKVYPVVDNGFVVGVITRRDVLKAISEQIKVCFKQPV
ncbi:CBS domain-containing protein [Vibrio sp. SS-MA-C1-2]|uniref:CBS domain-containing protein n=1 Tax=Vibrio sp. SS-MA-C1-2 TaxID=2908646 RepID=UPI001F1F3E6F|nr:CBS domain-containing protein [Vibrio sp. SS-MA-C1-2]UJF20007.1 CBS domain-containing protein [Vibrio sp. SS-MA-C1-2]